MSNTYMLVMEESSDQEITQHLHQNHHCYLEVGWKGAPWDLAPGSWSNNAENKITVLDSEITAVGKESNS